MSASSSPRPGNLNLAMAYAHNAAAGTATSVVRAATTSELRMGTRKLRSVKSARDECRRLKQPRLGRERRDRHPVDRREQQTEEHDGRRGARARGGHARSSTSERPSTRTQISAKTNVSMKTVTDSADPYPKR